MRKLRVRVDADLCTATGRCVMLAPAVFRLEADDDCAAVIQEVQADTPGLWQAARECPWDAIILMEAETGRQLYP